MAWIQLRVHTGKQEAELLSDYLMELGSVSITFEDGQDEPIFEPKLGETPLWNDTVVIALFDAGMDLAPVVEQIKTLPYMASDFTYKN